MTIQLLFYFLFLCCFAYGVAFFLIDSVYSEKIIQPILRKIVKFFRLNIIQETYDKAIVCYGCLGFWAGVFFGSVFEVKNIPISRTLFVLISGFMASGFSLFCNYLATYLLLQFKGKIDSHD
jgi:hypothetical protein